MCYATGKAPTPKPPSGLVKEPSPLNSNTPLGQPCRSPRKGDLCVRHRRVRRGLRKEQSNMIKTAINALRPSPTPPGADFPRPGLARARSQRRPHHLIGASKTTMVQRCYGAGAGCEHQNAACRPDFLRYSGGVAQTRRLCGSAAGYEGNAPLPLGLRLVNEGNEPQTCKSAGLRYLNCATSLSFLWRPSLRSES